MGNLNINSKTTYITKGGIYVALSLVILYASVLVPFNTMFILLLASSIIPLSILTIGVKPTIIVYIAVSSISYFIIPTKSICIMYLLFFGSYGFIKYFTKIFNWCIGICISLKVSYKSSTSRLTLNQVLCLFYLLSYGKKRVGCKIP